MSYTRIYANDNNLNKLSRWMTRYNYYIVVLFMFDDMSMCDVMFMFGVSMFSEPIMLCCYLKHVPLNTQLCYF